MEIKPFLQDFAQCEECQLLFTRHFCAEVCCLVYLCESCWLRIHNSRGLIGHKPMLKGRHKMKTQNVEQMPLRFLNANSLQYQQSHKQQRKQCQQQLQQQKQRQQPLQGQNSYGRNRVYYSNKEYQANTNQNRQFFLK